MNSDSVDRPPEAQWDILGAGFHESGLLERHAPKYCDSGTWWGGALDVEGLARHSAGLVGQSVAELTAGRCRLRSTPAQLAAGFESFRHLRVAGRKVQAFAPLSGFFPTADGWIRTHANYPHHERALLDAMRARTPEQLPGLLAQAGSLEAQERIVSAGGVAAAVRSRRQWLHAPEGQAAAAGHWAQFELHGVREAGAWQFRPEAKLPLAGLKILDFTRVIAGPTASRTLAALGAQVLRVDGPRHAELPDQHIDTGFGKRSTILDLAAVRGLAAAHGLLAQADAVILGYHPGALDALGLSAELLRECYPQLVIAQLCAWGFAGPWASRRGFDSIVQAATGIADAYRSPEGNPGTLPVQGLDYAAGYGIAAAVIALLRARRELHSTGTVRISLARTAQALFEFGGPSAPELALGIPRVSRCTSGYGMLDYALPPFELNGVQLDYPHSPTRYGADEPVWT
ncbi:CoA transferase [Glutamicibacter protophormiae]|uniref:CoA transferase n=1 Tax=Glutamicibacter protophormiae TaxID=37930 RepID=UPI002A837EE8|nr:CoA transferase [Glutamicibacter protophormiae]WPR65379.1 CoA transferase [Glutamicibacter protophormiae]WPR68877.1 CoA transferase [Glutamicibacter protophormiae]